jgi:glycerophosphoryl diester phosphodiesterase
VVAQSAARLWADAAVKPLLSSFEVDALRAARNAEPTLPRALLLDTLWPGWLETAQELGCQAIVCNYTLWDANTVALAKAAGFRTASYTVNDEWAAHHLIALGTDSIITDRVDRFSPMSFTSGSV